MIFICPGIHDQSLTESFVASLQLTQKTLILPTDHYPPLSALHILLFLRQNVSIHTTPLTWISFSAGVVGAAGASFLWQQWGGKTTGFFALDGWGVPLWGNFPIYRLSHDLFTHQTSAWFGTGQENFYAEPPVDHLDLWRSPSQVSGWQVTTQGRARTTAAHFIRERL